MAESFKAKARAPVFACARACTIDSRSWLAQWSAAHPMPADLSEEEFIEREYWCISPLRVAQCFCKRRLTLRHTSRRLVEGGEEQVTVDYANDLDTGMCVQ